MAEENQEEIGGELATLFPDQTLTLGGETVPVRALRFREGLELLPIIRPIIDGMQQLAEEAQDNPENLTSASVLGLLEDHPDAWVSLMAAAANRDADWVEGLDLEDGEALALAAWRANAPFLLRRLILGRMPATGTAQEAEGDGSATPRSSTS